MLLQVYEIKQIIEDLIDYIAVDYNSSTEEKSWLYILLHGEENSSNDLYEMARDIFLRTNKNPKKIQIRLEVPKDPTSLPCIVIREPSRIGGEGNPVGRIQQETTTGSTQRRYLLDSRSSRYEIMCVSANTTEALIISEVIYSLLIGSYNYLSTLFMKINIDMREMVMEKEIVPYPVVFRNIGLSVDSYVRVPDIETGIPSQTINFDQNVLHRF